MYNHWGFDLRRVLIATLILAFEAYGVLESYVCSDIVCLEPAFWMVMGLLIGIAIGGLIQCSRCSRAPSSLAMLGLSYSLIAAITALLLDRIPLMLAILALTVPYIFHSKSELCELAALSLAVSGYVAFMSLIEGVMPSSSLIVYLLLGILLATILCEAYLEAKGLERFNIVVSVCGIILVAMAGFYAAYAFQPYSVGIKHLNISEDCDGIAAHCIVLNTTRIPLAAWGYALIYAVQVAVTGVFLALPALRRG